MRLSTLIPALLFMLSMSFAKPEFSKPLIQSFFETTQKLESLKSKYPDIMNNADTFKFSEKEKMMKFIKGSKAFPEIKKIIAKTPMKTFDEFYLVSVRLMGSMYAVQKEQMPKMMEGIEKMMSEQIQKMKEQGAPADVVKEMEEKLQEQKEQINEMKEAEKIASEKDKKFIKDNIQWIMSISPDDMDD